MSVLAFLLSAPIDPKPIASLEDFWRHHGATAQRERLPCDRAILGGFHADRLAYAFVAGYQAALRAIAPDLPADRMASICITEKGGGHPRAIETRLTRVDEGNLRLDGHKRWASLARGDGVLLVAASEGVDEEGRNRLRIARVEAGAPGVSVTPMTAAAFLPEIEHAEVTLSGVMVREEDLFEGDGYECVIRPFRTVEDIHVQAAVFAYLLREARRIGLPRALIEKSAAQIVSLRALAEEDPSAAAIHIALGGALALGSALIGEIESAWSAARDSAAWERWERDRPLLGVASRVRSARLERAWERLS